jgi:phenylalanyl-tRNA synthetase alpha chain
MDARMDAPALIARIQAALDETLARIDSADGVEGLRREESELDGREHPLSSLKASLGRLTSTEDKRDAGRALNEAMTSARGRLAARLDSLVARDRDERIASEHLDLSEFLGTPSRGSTHVVTQAWERLVDVFVGMGFRVAEGPEVETDHHNFEALNMPASHPARSEFDTMFVEPLRDGDPPGSILLRTHTSPVQIRVMREWGAPIYAVMPGRVFRRDTPDATHMPVFHQIEGLVVDEDVTFGHLAGTIETFTKAFFGSDFSSRLRPSYFPFTEPSAEFDVRQADGSWVELGGCGMVHPNVLRAGGIDPERYSGFAFGFGIDRMAKERHRISDIREMYADDLRFSRQFR